MNKGSFDFIYFSPEAPCYDKSASNEQLNLNYKSTQTWTSQPKMMLQILNHKTTTFGIWSISLDSTYT